jgi:hypothetical protein
MDKLISTSQGKLYGTVETPKQLRESSERLQMLYTTAEMFGKDLDPAQVTQWKKFLDPCPLRALEYAFSTWQKSGRFFCKPAEILQLVDDWKNQPGNRVEFVPCGQCEEGWIRVYEGKMVGGKPIDPRYGALRRCDCFLRWAKS